MIAVAVSIKGQDFTLKVISKMCLMLFDNLGFKSTGSVARGVEFESARGGLYGFTGSTIFTVWAGVVGDMLLLFGL